MHSELATFALKGIGFRAGMLDVSTLDALRSGMPALGGTCLACHDAYRIEKN